MFIIELEGFNSIVVVGNDYIWISRKVFDMNCFDSEGRFIKIIYLSMGEILNDIIVIEDGDIFYIDWKLLFINVVKNGIGNIEEKIILYGWIFVNLCVIFFNDLFVFMYKEDGLELKVV